MKIIKVRRITVALRNVGREEWKEKNERFVETSKGFDKGNRSNTIEARRCGWRRRMAAWLVENEGCERGHFFLGFHID